MLGALTVIAGVRIATTKKGVWVVMPDALCCCRRELAWELANYLPSMVFSAFSSCSAVARVRSEPSMIAFTLPSFETTKLSNAILFELYPAVDFLFRSTARVYVVFVLPLIFLRPFTPSFSSRKTNTNSVLSDLKSAACFCNSTSCLMQNGHQLARLKISTTFFSPDFSLSESLNVFPSTPVAVKSGAGWPTSAFFVSSAVATQATATKHVLKNTLRNIWTLINRTDG